jgi:hypothetical protein
MESEFIPYTEALELKELGFDEPCFGWFRSTLIPSNFTEYFLETKFGMNESPSDWVNSNFLDKACSAPLYQQAFRWLLKEHNLYAIIIPTITMHWTFKTMTIIEGMVEAPPYKHVDAHDYVTQEEAELASLEKLIEIVKEK